MAASWIYRIEITNSAPLLPGRTTVWRPDYDVSKQLPNTELRGVKDVTQ
jgi:hypothetical protein